MVHTRNIMAFKIHPSKTVQLYILTIKGSLITSLTGNGQLDYLKNKKNNNYYSTA